MNFDELKRRVERSEQLVEGRIQQTLGHRAQLGLQWRQAWTPGRIIIAGLVGGFLAARARPLRGVGSVPVSKWLQMATSLSGLFASLKAAYAAETAESAATEAESAAQTAEAVVEDAATPDVFAAPTEPTQETLRAAVSDGRRRPDAQWEAPPRPAEAATDVSER